MRSVIVTQYFQVVSCKRIDKLLEQVYVDLRLKSSLQKFFDHYHELVDLCAVSFHMRTLRALPVRLVHAPIVWWSPGFSFTLSFLCVFFRFLFVLCCFCLRFLASSLSLDFWVLTISLTVVFLKFIFKIEDK
jgi:hypothetical protein